MYYVTYSTIDAPDVSVKVFSHQVIEPCVEFAMALHRSSNVFHKILVALDSGDTRLTLTLKENPKGKN